MALAKTWAKTRLWGKEESRKVTDGQKRDGPNRNEHEIPHHEIDS